MGEKGKTKKRGETAKTFPLPRLPLGSLRCPNLSSFFFLSPNPEPGPRLLVSQRLKKTDRARTQTYYHYMGLEYPGIRGTTYLVGVKSKAYQRLQG